MSVCLAKEMAVRERAGWQEGMSVEQYLGAQVSYMDKWKPQEVLRSSPSHPAAHVSKGIPGEKWVGLCVAGSGQERTHDLAQQGNKAGSL